MSWSEYKYPTPRLEVSRMGEEITSLKEEIRDKADKASEASSYLLYVLRCREELLKENATLKQVIESQNTYIETLKADSGRKETEENLTAQLRDAWEERDQAQAKCEEAITNKQSAVVEAVKQYQLLDPDVRLAALQTRFSEVSDVALRTAEELHAVRAECEKQRALRCTAEAFLQEAQAKEVKP